MGTTQSAKYEETAVTVSAELSSANAQSALTTQNAKSDGKIVTVSGVPSSVKNQSDITTQSAKSDGTVVTVSGDLSSANVQSEMTTPSAKYDETHDTEKLSSVHGHSEITTPRAKSDGTPMTVSGELSSANVQSEMTTPSAKNDETRVTPTPTLVQPIERRATIQEFPFFVSVFTGNTTRYVHGSGSIVSKDWIVTTSNLKVPPRDEVVDNSTHVLNVRAGVDELYDGGSIHEIDQVIKHPSDDIALLHVKEPFKFDDTHQSIPMFNRDEKYEDNGRAEVIDFNETDYKLVVYQLSLLSLERCNATHNQHIIIEPMSAGTVCTEDNKFPLLSLSGAPLLINGRLAGFYHMKWRVDDFFFTEYTGIAYHRDWIDSEISKYESNQN